ncbi:MAG: RraA family protein [Dehalococcoidia bacterium]
MAATNRLLESWAGYATATISDCLDRLQAMHSGIRLLSGEGLVGHAFTVETGAGDSATLHRALELVPPDSVLVVDAAGHLGRAVWGNVLSVAAMRRGVRGIVVDGVIRDLAEIHAAGFVTYARGVCPAGPHKGFQGRWGEPIQCGGVVVATGDLVVGDGDGVVVVPASRIDETERAVLATEERERLLLEDVNRGATTAELLGLKHPSGLPAVRATKRGKR